MLNYLIRRLIGTIPLLLGITFLTCLLLSFLPGGPVSQIADLNPKVSPEVRMQLMKQYDLDKPFHVRYIKWLKNMARLDFGVSQKDQVPVMNKIKQRLPRTLLLTISTMVLTFLLAIPLGIFSALKQNSLWDRLMTIFVFIGYSIPTWWLGLLLMVWVGIYLGWLPITGYSSLYYDELSAWGKVMDVAKHLILPLVVTGLTSLAGLSRYMRNGMLEVIRQDYIRTARAKGLPENKVIFVHALRNCLIPIVTILGLSLPGLLSGGIIFETLFSYPGIGRLMYEAAISRDFPLIMADVTILAFLTLLGNIIADISYAYVDPRIRVK